MTLDQPDRRALECAGWRTLLDYRENHIRGRDGVLLDVVPCWIAEAERVRDRVLVASVTAPTIDDAWARLRAAAVAAERHPFDGNGEV
jgi:hypothetical protein